jgi:hypothetical protein
MAMALYRSSSKGLWIKVVARHWRGVVQQVA